MRSAWVAAASSASFRAEMSLCATTAPPSGGCSGVTCMANQRNSVAEWQGYSITKTGWRPASTASMPAAAACASGASGPVAARQRSR